MTQLRPKQAAFIEEYLIDFNGTQAAIRAGYSPRTANEQAAQLLAKLSVQEALAARKAELAEQKEITAEKVLAEYAALAFSDMGQYVEWGPRGLRVKSSDELPAGATKAITEITEVFSTNGVSVKLKLADKKAALDSICRMLGFNAPDKQDVRGIMLHQHNVDAQQLESRIEQYADIIHQLRSGETDSDGPGESLDSVSSG